MGSWRGFLMISSHVFGVRKKVFGQVFNRENTNFANLRDPFLRLLGLLWRSKSLLLAPKMGVVVSGCLSTSLLPTDEQKRRKRTEGIDRIRCERARIPFLKYERFGEYTCWNHTWTVRRSACARQVHVVCVFVMSTSLPPPSLSDRGSLFRRTWLPHQRCHRTPMCTGARDWG